MILFAAALSPADGKAPLKPRIKRLNLQYYIRTTGTVQRYILFGFKMKLKIIGIPIMRTLCTDPTESLIILFAFQKCPVFPVSTIQYFVATPRKTKQANLTELPSMPFLFRHFQMFHRPP